MLEIGYGARGEIVLTGRFDASHAERAETFLDGVDGAVVADLGKLEYISSLGLGVLLKTQKRLRQTGGGLKLIGLSPHLREIFRYSGFDRVFEIESP